MKEKIVTLEMILDRQLKIGQRICTCRGHYAGIITQYGVVSDIDAENIRIRYDGGGENVLYISGFERTVAGEEAAFQRLYIVNEEQEAKPAAPKEKIITRVMLRAGLIKVGQRVTARFGDGGDGDDTDTVQLGTVIGFIDEYVRIRYDGGEEVSMYIHGFEDTPEEEEKASSCIYILDNDMTTAKETLITRNSFRFNIVKPGMRVVTRFENNEDGTEGSVYYGRVQKIDGDDVFIRYDDGAEDILYIPGFEFDPDKEALAVQRLYIVEETNTLDAAFAEGPAEPLYMLLNVRTGRILLNGVVLGDIQARALSDFRASGSTDHLAVVAMDDVKPVKLTVSL